MYLGDFRPGDIFRFHFTTRRFSTGAPYTLAGTPGISVYKDESDAQSTAGVTLSADADGVTGMNRVKIDTSADATFYSGGSDYHIAITAGTVDSVSVVGEIVAEFSIEHRTPSGVDIFTVDGSSSATAIVASALTQSATDHWKDRVVLFVSGSLKYQAKAISAFTPASDTLTVDAFTGAPSTGDRFAVI